MSVANNTSTGQTSAGGSQATSPCPFPIQDKPRQTRKRVRNEDDWKINIRKRLRNRGQSYVSRTGKTHRNRVLKSNQGVGTCVETSVKHKSQRMKGPKFFTVFGKWVV